jgi:hypothetical protein
MTSIALHPTPEWQTVAKEQVGTVGLALRKEIWLFFIALAAFAALIIWSAIRGMHGQGSQQGSLAFGPSGVVPMVLLALFIPFSVWRGEDPSRRSYHWTMPVARGPHTLTKVLAGWIWVMAALVVYLLFIFALGAVVRQITGRYVASESLPAWEWVLAFTSTTIAYLLGSIAVVASDHPWRWLIGICTAYGLAIWLFKSLGLFALVQRLLDVVVGRYGLSSAIFGNVMGPGRVPSMSLWLSATLAWGAVGVIGVLLASYHRPRAV